MSILAEPHLYDGKILCKRALFLQQQVQCMSWTIGLSTCGCSPEHKQGAEIKSWHGWFFSPSLCHVSPALNINGAAVRRAIYAYRTGGHGAVFHADWGDYPCAAKQFYMTQSDFDQKAIQDEINIIQRLRHRNIIQFFRTHQHEGIFYLITDIAENGSLAGALGRQQFAWSTKLRIAHEIARGLEYIHQQKVIHRDLKSANVLLSRYMEVKLCDFGLAKVKTASMSQSQSVGFSQSTGVLGTMRWMAPEILASKPSYSTKSDVYALGMVMWELAANCNKPFKDQVNNTAISRSIRSGSRETIPNDTPGQFRAWIEACWHQDPTQRPEASEVVLVDDGPDILLSQEPATNIPSSLDNDPSKSDRGVTTHMESGAIGRLDLSIPYNSDGDWVTNSLTASSPDSAQVMPPARDLGTLDIGVLIQEANENDNAEAQVRLAEKYDKGDGVFKNECEAYFWRLCAANQGHIQAQVLVADMMFDGRGTLKDESKAGEWYKKAAEQGSASAMHRIGRLYEQGRGGFVKSPVMALSSYRKGALKGDPAAQRCLGDCYLQARGTPQDDKSAKRWYLSSAQQGDAVAQRSLGWLFLTGRGVEQSDATAIQWYRAAAEQGDADAQCSLGYLYERGQGVTRDNAQAIEWYRKSALLGNPAAQNNLASMYFSGQGVDRDVVAAVSWYRKAAEQGYTLALNSLAWMYEHGHGVARDDGEAARWYHKAAIKGNMSAQLRLAQACEAGALSLSMDIDQAVEWYRRAAAQGSSQALASLERLGKEHIISDGLPREKEE